MAGVEVNGARLEVFESGAGDPPLVFVHGLGGDHSAWWPQIEDLSRDHHCVAVDLRGCGASDRVGPFDVEQQAQDVAALLEALELPPVVLVGHSLGGPIVLLANSIAADRIVGVVTVDSPLNPSGLSSALGERLAEQGSIEPLRAVFERFWTSETPEQVKEGVTSTMLRSDLATVTGLMGPPGVPPERMTALVKEADRKPFMAIWAATPIGNPAWLRDTAPFVRQEPVAGTGHFPQLERPDVVSALLRAFLDDVASDPRLPAGNDGA